MVNETFDKSKVLKNVFQSEYSSKSDLEISFAKQELNACIIKIYHRSKRAQTKYPLLKVFFFLSFRLVTFPPEGVIVGY
jgi:hypothetical protein